MNKYISLDIGGTMLKYGIISENGTIDVFKEIATEAYKGGPYIIKNVCCIIKEHQATYDLKGICISTAGMVDANSGTIIYANDNIPQYTGMNIKKLLEKKFKIPCEVENDVACAGLSEHYVGASKGSSVSLCLTIGTGIGGCIIINNRIFHGFSNSAGEIGYMKMRESDFQSIASTSALVRKVNFKKGYEENQLDGRQIFDLAKTGDEICKKAIEELCDELGYGIANICCVINPEVVVLGGGIMKQQEYLYNPLKNSLDKYLISTISRQTKLTFAQNGNQAGMLGAYYNFREKHKGWNNESI